MKEERGENLNQRKILALASEVLCLGLALYGVVTRLILKEGRSFGEDLLTVVLLVVILWGVVSLRARWRWKVSKEMVRPIGGVTKGMLLLVAAVPILYGAVLFSQRGTLDLYTLPHIFLWLVAYGLLIPGVLYKSLGIF